MRINLFGPDGFAILQLLEEQRGQGRDGMERGTKRATSVVEDKEESLRHRRVVDEWSSVMNRSRTSRAERSERA